jgi:hypothetical protein
MAEQTLVGQGLLIIDASRSHSGTTTVGTILLDECLARRREKHTALTRDWHSRTRRGIRTRNPSKRLALDRVATRIDKQA